MDALHNLVSHDGKIFGVDWIVFWTASAVGNQFFPVFSMVCDGKKKQVMSVYFGGSA